MLVWYKHISIICLSYHSYVQCIKQIMCSVCCIYMSSLFSCYSNFKYINNSCFKHNLFYHDKYTTYALMLQLSHGNNSLPTCSNFLARKGMLSTCDWKSSTLRLSTTITDAPLTALGRSSLHHLYKTVQVQH